MISLWTVDENDNCYCGGDIEQKTYICRLCDGTQTSKYGGRCECGDGEETVYQCNECKEERYYD